MRILVFDANISFAREAMNFIEDKVSGAKAEMASNIFILRERLQSGEWDVILADVAAAMDMEGVLKELDKADCPVIVWSTLNDTLAQRKDVFHKFQLINKPKTTEQFDRAMALVSSQ